MTGKEQNLKIGRLPVKYGLADMDYSIDRIIDDENMIVTARIYNPAVSGALYWEIWIQQPTKGLFAGFVWHPRGVYRTNGTGVSHDGTREETYRKYRPVRTKDFSETINPTE